eukprot:COSAG01_NODE_8170_length_2892_cov_21.246330_1_plen_53_part_00
MIWLLPYTELAYENERKKRHMRRGRLPQAGMPVRRGEVDVMAGAMYLNGIYY